jgi:proteasome accessory factor C
MALVPWLMTHDGVTIQEAADHFGISSQQCEKDLWLLVVCGLPGHMPDQLVDIQFWDDGRIHVIDPQTLDRPLRLSGDEVMSLLVALRMLAQVPGTHDRKTLYRLIHRLEHSLEKDAIGTVLIDSGVNASALITIETALEQSRMIELLYASGTDDSVTKRSVHPIRVFAADGFTYLEAYCEQAEAIRTFRLDRVMEAELGANATRGFTDLGQDQIDPEVAIVEIDHRAHWVLDLYPITGVNVDNEGTMHGELAYRDLEWLAKIVLSLGGSMRVVEPPAARAGVASAAVKALAAYS